MKTDGIGIFSKLALVGKRLYGVYWDSSVQNLLRSSGSQMVYVIRSTYRLEELLLLPFHDWS